MNFNFIHKLRIQKELTLKEMSSLTKLSVARIGKIERNQVDPKASEIESLLKVLNYKMVAKDAINTYRDEEFICVNGN